MHVMHVTVDSSTSLCVPGTSSGRSMALDAARQVPKGRSSHAVHGWQSAADGSRARPRESKFEQLNAVILETNGRLPDRD